MFDNLPPNIRRWGSIVLLAIAAIWVWYNPDILFEEEYSGPQTSTSQRVDKSPKPSLSKTEADFDFYVLALSWSPSFCASNPRAAKYQCGGKRFFSFIVHGLWPQFEKGWPSFCDKNNQRIRNNLVNSMLDIMPGQGLIRNQWKKHGTCTGLDQKTYFSKVRTAYEKIRFPAQFRFNNKYINISPGAVERAFQTENPGLPDNAIAVTCGKRRLKEVRICLSKSLEFRACTEVDRQSCRKEKIIMPPVRGT